MAKSVQKITLSQSRDIPFNKLVLSQSNVRRIKAGVSIEELAQDIARRTLLQSLTVRPVVDGDGNETGMFEVPAGGRRFRALELLIQQKRLARTAPIPCVVRTEGLAEEDSLAENVQRAPLHPLDQFRAFCDLREKGMSEEEIAAVFFVSIQVVKQRLKLASVSPKLLDVYAEDGMTLDQLMAFTVNSVVVEQWPALDGHYPAVAYQYAFGLSLVFQAAALVWFAIPWLRTYGECFFRLFTRPTAEHGDRAGFIRVPDEGPVLDAQAQMEW
jgi:ParB/RepB/Spo0J family partition protein